MSNDTDLEIDELRMYNMMQVIDMSILTADNPEDQLMLACAMLQRTREIFDSVLGAEGRKKMFKEYV